MLVLVDGYNVTMRDPALAARSKQVQRDVLTQRLRALAGRIAPKGRVVVVFDARESIGASAESFGPVRVVFASDADSEIVRRAAAASGQVAVYTDDLRLRARLSQDVGRHVEYRDVSALFAAGRRGAGAGAARGSVAGHGGHAAGRLPHAGEERLPKDAEDITAELSELWLDDERE